MWVPGSGSWVFGEIGGLREMSGGGRKMSIFKHVWEYFCQVGAVQISIFYTYFIKILNFSNCHFSRIFRILYRGRRHERSH